jgi:agmatine/peptidylarginine deiminase
LVVKSFEGTHLMVDCDYWMVEPQTIIAGTADYRSHADRLPRALTSVLGLNVAYAPISLEGGNLLSNGAGLCVTSEATLWHNAEAYRYSEADVSRILREYFGAEQVVYLEPLEGEPTAHVDLFIAFTDHDTIVVGECSREADPVNAEILDRNAQRLSEVKTACGPLRVFRVPMPRVRDGRWYTYTNLVYANGTVLVPVYPDLFPEHEPVVLNLYRRLLPGWNVVAIDCLPLVKKGGGLHCATMNLYRTGTQRE